MAADPRSYLYVPGHRPDRVAKAFASAADAVVVDLEDAVPATAKEDARATLASLPADGRAWVRINAGSAAADITAAVSPALTGLFVPKAEPALLHHVDELLTTAERDRGMPHGQVAVIALVETALGVLRAEQVCQAPRVVRLGIGEADLAGELRLRPDDRRTELHGVRLRIVLAAAATGTGAPVGPVETNLADPDFLAESTRTLLRQGFRARTVLHPRQVAVVNAVFTPSAEEVAAARTLLADLTEREGAVVAGRFVDAAVLRGARETLARVRD